MTTRTLSPILVMLALVACSAEQEVDTPQLAEVMPVVPLPPDSRLVGSVGSEEARQFTFLSSHDPDDLVAYYRGTFVTAPWTLISDATGPDGGVILYVENDGIPLWVRIIATPGAPGSTVQLSGALIKRNKTLVDSLTAPEGE